ncbi:MAG: GGDEF domain-containing protein [Myxococcota bacterium]
MAFRRVHRDVDSAPPIREKSASLNSVSNRIILCVFFSTFLTAVIVSWLGIRSIHHDVRQRTAQRAEGVLVPRVDELARLLSSATAELAVASSVDSPWHRAMLAAADAEAEAGQSGAQLIWHSERSARSAPGAFGAVQSALPVPPIEIQPLFDRVRFVLGPTQATDETPLQGDQAPCYSAKLKVYRQSAPIVGQLEGCLDRELVLTLLHSDPRDLRGMRVLLVDPAGQARETAGVRGAARLGQVIPMVLAPPSHSASIAEYEDDRRTALIGLQRRIGQSGWSLIAETEKDSAFAPAIAITKQIIGVDICIILAFSLIAQRIARALMAPIEALSEGAHRIAAGNVDYQIPSPVNPDDELGRLTGTFNQMMAKLRSNQQLIEEDRFRLAEKNDELQHANEILAQLSITDGLTKLHNHRYFQDHLTREIKRVSRTKAPLSLILLDIDDFKLLNDTYGHAAGDEVLVSLAAIMNDSARESDLIARYGGEEFVVLMPGTDLAGAVHLAEKIRMAVESTRLIIGEHMRPVNVTISVGVALYSGNRRNLFVEADRALYQAKDAGKNCVIIAGSA